MQLPDTEDSCILNADWTPDAVIPEAVICALCLVSAELR